MGSSNFFFTYSIILMVMVGVGYVVALTRSGSLAKIPLGGNYLSVWSQLSAEDIFQRLSQDLGRYKLEDSRQDELMLLYTNGPTFGTWGFFYPIQIVRQEKGCEIRVGIKSRFFQWGPLVTKWHKKCVQHVELATGQMGEGVPSARVVGH